MSLYSDMKNRGDSGERVWRALSDAMRRELLDALTGGPKTTGELVDRFDHLCRTAVMKHLDVLVAAKLVIVRRQGRVRWNYLNPVPIERVCARWVDGHVRRMGSALNRLKDVVEADLPATPQRCVKEQES